VPACRYAACGRLGKTVPVGSLGDCAERVNDA